MDAYKIPVYLTAAHITPLHGVTDQSFRISVPLAAILEDYHEIC